MPSSAYSTLSLLFPFIFIVTYLVYRSNRSTRRHFPPGPKGLPFVGNVFQMPSGKQPETFRAWASEYGDLVYVQIFGQPMVIIDSLQAVRDLLDKRSSIYSDRPRFVLFSELMGWHAASTHVRYGPRFRKHRRFMNQLFNSRVVSAFTPLQQQETLKFLDRLLKTPDSFVEHFRRFAAGTILKITYGYEVHSADDKIVQLAERAATMTVQSGTPAATLVDFFPVMRHIPTWAPGSSFKRNALETRKAVNEMMDTPFEFVKEKMKSGLAIPSYTSSLLESRRCSKDGSLTTEDEEDIKGSAGTLYAAAEDTTSAVLHSFVLAMVLNPRVFKKLQEELDIVVGNSRLPTLEDRPSLPYLECVLKETLRWNPPVPLGMPHRLMDDDYYRDYLIPKNSTILVNIYSILRDCPNPDAFYPERYLDEDSLPDPKSVIFGFGRRICPGRFLADSSLWMILSSLAALFDISKAHDTEGREVDPSVDFVEGFVRHPKAFPCSIKPRSASVTSLINQAKAEL